MTEVEQMASGKPKCVGCGAELPANASGQLCPKCLLKIAMETQPAAGPGGTVRLPGTAVRSAGLPQPGEQLGHYSIIRLLGAGGMGAVFEAEDLDNGRRIALKVLSHTLDAPDARERFFREGRLAASINHPNSVYVFGTEEVGGTPVIAMELVAGGTLQDRVRDKGPLPVGEAVDSVLQIIEGLEAAQRIGILHRDIKPSNCYTSEEGVVKIGDFGLSISTTIRTEPALTATGTFLGTPAFCSPEQLRGEELNARSDMYSVGATLFYLLTGRTPFEASSVVQLLAIILEREPPSPCELRPNMPAGLAKVVLRCLEKQPGERFKSYAELRRELSPYGSAAPTPATLSLRFVAGALDMTLLGGLATVINLAAFGSAMEFMNQIMQLSPGAVACLIVWFCALTLYYTVFEGLWGAATGKAICRLRVVGAERNPPGFLRAWLRALIYNLPPFAPFWITFGANPKAYMTASPLTQGLLGVSCYGIMALLFVTARRRNGFAAVQDVLTGTRVIARAALTSRPGLAASELSPPLAESAVTIGPYHVLQRIAETPDEKWFLGYDLKLLRRVWLRVVPRGAPPVSARLRSLGRIGRLRWLTGKRSLLSDEPGSASPAPGDSPSATSRGDENWDAFEALSGRPFLELVATSQPWSEVRFWLYDLAAEIGAAERDGTLPELTLDRLWITAEGRAKLLDFPAPGLGTKCEIRNPKSEASANIEAQTPQRFLDNVARMALAGGLGAGVPTAAEVPKPLQLHARAFLKGVAQLTGAQAVAAALKPLLSRPAAVSKWRRTALVGGCMAFPLLACGFGFFGLSFLQDIAQKNPGLMQLSGLLQLRQSARFWVGKDAPSARANLPTDQQIEVYIAHHYRGLVTNEASWSSPYVMSLIKGDARKFAEKSVTEYPAPSEAEIAEADAAVDKYLPKDQFSFAKDQVPTLPVMVLATSLLVYVGLPAVLAALLFRGGVVVLIAGVTYVRKDGQRASRLRLLWRALVAWVPVLPVAVVAIVAISKHWTWEPWFALALLAALAAASLALPQRGLQDRLAGTWPVPR